LNFSLGENRDIVFIVWYELIAGGNPKEWPLQGYRGGGAARELPRQFSVQWGPISFGKPKSRAVAVNRRNPVCEEFEAPTCLRCVSKNNDDTGETATGELLTSFVVGKLSGKPIAY